MRVKWWLKRQKVRLTQRAIARCTNCGYIVYIPKIASIRFREFEWAKKHLKKCPKCGKENWSIEPK